MKQHIALQKGADRRVGDAARKECAHGRALVFLGEALESREQEGRYSTLRGEAGLWTSRPPPLCPGGLP